MAPVRMPPTPRNMPGPEKFHSVTVNGLSAMRVKPRRHGGRTGVRIGLRLPQRLGRRQRCSRKCGWST